MGSLNMAMDRPSWVDTTSPTSVKMENTSSSAIPSSRPMAICSMAVRMPFSDSGSSVGMSGSAAVSAAVTAIASSTRTRMLSALWLNSGARLNTAMIRQNGHQ